MLSYVLMLILFLIPPHLHGAENCSSNLIQPIEDRRGVRWENVNILEVLDHLEAAGLTLNITGLRHSDAQATIVLSKFLGVDVRVFSLYQAVRKKYGNWDEALRQSGRDPAAYRKHFAYDLSREKIIRAIVALNRVGVPLSPQSINTDTSEFSRSIIKRETGYPITASALYGRGVHAFGNWAAALHAAGLNPTLILKHGFRHERSREALIRMLQGLSQKITMTHGELMRNHADVQNFLYAQFGEIISPNTLYNWARVEFGSWANGLVVSQVRLPLEAWTAEDAGELLLDLNARRETQVIYNAVADWPEDQKRLLETSMETLDGKSGFPAQEMVVSHILRRTGKAWKWSDITLMLSVLVERLAEN